MTNASFHSGELLVQDRAGEAAIARRNGSAISGKVMFGARPFLRLQPMIVLSSSDEESAMWASIVSGRPGFLASQDGASLDIDLNRALVDPGDPEWANIRITRRDVRITSLETPEADGAPKSGAELTEASFAAFGNADTMFVATRSDEGGYDVSHPGGLPGFLKVTGPLTIQWPEYLGNSMFNALGNLVHNPEAGLAIPDFERGLVLQLTAGWSRYGTRAIPLTSAAAPIDLSS
jgi:predicted pyridoxine 5'-phosphate oxidase superfamily flavin-nucleotide-binding protein